MGLMIKTLIMISRLQDGEHKMELIIGLLETAGAATGEKKEISDLLEVLTISVLNQLARGQHLRILGPKM